jgi:hypothetical protein
VKDKALPVPGGISAIALCLVPTVRLRAGLLYRPLAVARWCLFVCRVSGVFPMNASLSRASIYRKNDDLRGSNKLQARQH